MGKVFGFPDPVNEVSARVVAGGVLVMSVAAIGLGLPWLLVPLAYGFVARVATGPKLSPLGQFATRIVTPRLPFAPKFVPGPPKRFAQAIGAVVTVTALGLFAGFGLRTPAFVVLGVLVVAAGMESLLGICIGCKIFALLMRTGIIPESVCEACNNFNLDDTARRPPSNSLQ